MLQFQKVMSLSSLHQLLQLTEFLVGSKTPVEVSSRGQKNPILDTCGKGSGQPNHDNSRIDSWSVVVPYAAKQPAARIRIPVPSGRRVHRLQSRPTSPCLWELIVAHGPGLHRPCRRFPGC